MKPFQLKPNLVTLTVTFILIIVNLDFVAAGGGGLVFHKHILLFTNTHISSTF